MESFFLAETTKYLYLLFDEDNFISKHQKLGMWGQAIETLDGQCIVDAGGYVFNTEAHPIDISAVHCCSLQHKNDLKELRKSSEKIDIFNTYLKNENVRNVFRTKFRRKSDPVVTYYPPDDIPSPDANVTTQENGSNSDEQNDTPSNGNCDRINPTESGHPIQTVMIPAKLDSYATAKPPTDKSSSNVQYGFDAVNKTLESQYNRLMCPAQPFLLRLSIMGQMFYVT